MPTFNWFIRDTNKEPDPGRLTLVGTFVPIEIHIPTNVAQLLTKIGEPLPPCEKGVALVDTGATITSVEERILIKLGLSPVGIVKCGTANGQVVRKIYPVRLVLPTMNGWTLENTQAIGVNLKGQEVATVPPEPIVALLGRNLLQQWVFTYNGPGGFWTVSM